MDQSDSDLWHDRGSMLEEEHGGACTRTCWIAQLQSVVANLIQRLVVNHLHNRKACRCAGSQVQIMQKHQSWRRFSSSCRVWAIGLSQGFNASLWYKHITVLKNSVHVIFISFTCSVQQVIWLKITGSFSFAFYMLHARRYTPISYLRLWGSPGNFHELNTWVSSYGVLRNWCEWCPNTRMCMEERLRICTVPQLIALTMTSSTISRRAWMASAALYGSTTTSDTLGEGNTGYDSWRTQNMPRVRSGARWARQCTTSLVHELELADVLVVTGSSRMQRSKSKPESFT